MSKQFKNKYDDTTLRIIKTLEEKYHLEVSDTDYNVSCHISGDFSRILRVRLIGATLPTIPPELMGFRYITKLYIKDCTFTDLDSVPLQFLKLDSIDMFNCKLQSIPTWIFKQPRLVDIGLDDNNISSIPEEIVNLPDLWALSMRNNKLTHIPHFVSQLTKLKDVYFDRNFLEELPTSLFQLPNIREIMLDNNTPPFYFMFENILGPYDPEGDPYIDEEEDELDDEDNFTPIKKIYQTPIGKLIETVLNAPLDDDSLLYAFYRVYKEGDSQIRENLKTKVENNEHYTGIIQNIINFEEYLTKKQ